MNKRTIGITVLVAVVLFYALGTGFPFFYKFLYFLIVLLGTGSLWALLNLRGIDVEVTRPADRGQVGGYLEGEVTIVNRTWLPKSWLEVVEATGPSADQGGRGLALIRGQRRRWRVRTFLDRRGVYRGSVVRVLSQDPFGLFRFRRAFNDPQSYIVFPATEPLPGLDPRFAGLPSDSRVTKHWDQTTTDVASIRGYEPGDSFRRIHWPYSARMNSLMVKQFDIGLAAEAWVILDMHGDSHWGVAADRADNTEELAVTAAASIVDRLTGMSLPVGLASNGDSHHLYRPDSSPEHLGRLMEVFAEVRAEGDQPLPEFLYEIRSHLNQFNTVTVVTASTGTGWAPALADLRNRGVNVAAVLIDPSGFGGPGIEEALEGASSNLIPVYVARRGQRLDDALAGPVNREVVVTPHRYYSPLAERT